MPECSSEMDIMPGGRPRSPGSLCPCADLPVLTLVTAESNLRAKLDSGKDSSIVLFGNANIVRSRLLGSERRACITVEPGLWLCAFRPGRLQHCHVPVWT